MIQWPSMQTAGPGFRDPSMQTAGPRFRGPSMQTAGPRFSVPQLYAADTRFEKLSRETRPGELPERDTLPWSATLIMWSAFPIIGRVRHWEGRSDG